VSFKHRQSTRHEKERQGRRLSTSEVGAALGAIDATAACSSENLVEAGLDAMLQNQPRPSLGTGDNHERRDQEIRGAWCRLCLSCSRMPADLVVSGFM
jgi:hypothetical protein